MNPRPQPQEPTYLISESRFKEICRLLNLTDSYKPYVYACEEVVYSHPHTPAPAAEFTDAENKWCDDYAAAYNRGFDAGAKAERERFAKGLIEYSNRMGIYNCEEAVGDYLESLRSTQHQAGEP